MARIRHPANVAESISIPASVDTLRTYLQDGRPHLVRDPQEDVLFLNQRGKGLTRQGLWLVVKRWAEAAGIQGSLSPHTLRHTRARDLLQRGVNRREVQRFLGLSSPNAIRIHTRRLEKDE
jgi:integrase/recombinase XerD